MRTFPARIAGFVCAVSLLTVSACGKARQQEAPGVPPVVKGVVLETVETASLPDLVEAVGTIRARTSAVLAARIPGTITALHAREGDRVAKGKLLISLESVESTAGAAGSRAAVTEAERGVEEAAARKSLAEATFVRYQKLYAEQAVTRQEFEGRQMERDVAVHGLARAEARLGQSREAARAAGTTAGYTRITAPFSGIVTVKNADVGMTVFPGMPLITVEEEGHYRLEIAAPESLVGKVQPGNVVTVSIEGLLGDVKGGVAEVVPMVDPVTRTFAVKVDITGSGLRSGMYGRVSFPVGRKDGLFVPKKALIERGALTSLWVAGKDNIARMRLVKTGKTVGDKVEVLAGLTGGERVVTGGVEKVVDGAKIE